MKQINLILLFVGLFFLVDTNAQTCDNGSFTFTNSQLDYQNDSGSYTNNDACGKPITVTAKFLGGAPINSTDIQGNYIYINQDGSGSSISTFTYTFSEPVNISSIRIGDIDRSSTYTDEVRITANNGSNVSINSTSRYVGIKSGNNTPTATVEAIGGGANDNGSATFSTDGPVTELKIEYLDQNTRTGYRFIFIDGGATVCCPPPCNAGTNAPVMTDVTNFVASTSTYTIPCGFTTADLTSLVSSNLPSGTGLTVHTGTPATNANKVNSATALGTGTYYVSFYDATNDCYSPTTQITVNQETNCCKAGNIAPTVE